jgi:hypothetical protein
MNAFCVREDVTRKIGRRNKAEAFLRVEHLEFTAVHFLCLSISVKIAAIATTLASTGRRASRRR